MKPHILSLAHPNDSGNVLNLDHFNLGPHEMSAWAQVFSTTDISEIRLSHNRISHCINSLLPALAGRSLGGIGEGVVKLYAMLSAPKTKQKIRFIFDYFQVSIGLRSGCCRRSVAVSRFFSCCKSRVAGSIAEQMR